MNFIGGVIAATICLGFATQAAAEPKMYWTDVNKQRIERANLDGSGREVVLGDLNTPFDIEIDVVDGKMYWMEADPSSGPGFTMIRRANLDGSGVEDLVIGLLGLPLKRNFALDLTGGKMYWPFSVFLEAETIKRANLDGSEVEELGTGLKLPKFIAVDGDDGKMYVIGTLVGGVEVIQRANLDVSGVENLLTFDPNSGGIFDIALDLTGGKMYWLHSFGTLIKIQRANLDGSGMEDLVTFDQDTITGFPGDIALDPAAGKMYWTDGIFDTIQRANLDGTGIEDVLTDLPGPSDIALALDDPGGSLPDPLIGGTPVDGLPAWFFSEWFGFYNTDLAPWLFHAEHGFIYRFPDSTNDSMFVYDHAMTAWSWTNESTYPYLFRFSDGVWLWYQEGSKGPRWFNILSTGEWESW